MAKKKKTVSPKKHEEKNPLRSLKRAELLELLIEQTRRADELEAKLEKANRELENRNIGISNAGSIAEAALQLNHVFEAADKAAQQYLDSIRRIYEAVQKAKDPIAVEKLGTFVAGKPQGQQQAKPAPAKPAAQPQPKPAPKPAAPAQPASHISADIANMIASGIGGSGTAKPKPAAKPASQPQPKATPKPSPQPKPAAKPAAPQKSAQNKYFTQGMQLGQYLQMAADDIFVDPEPAPQPVKKPAPRQTPATKSTIPFKSSLAPAPKPKQQPKPKPAGNGIIDVAEIFANK